MHETRIQKLKQKKKLHWKVFFHRNQENNRLIHSFINSRPIKLLIYTWSSWFSLTLPQGLSPGARRNINNLRYADDTILMAESDEEIKSLLMKVKGESEKAGLNLNIQKMKIMAPCPITSWEIDGETMEAVRGFTKSLRMVTADPKLRKHFLLGDKSCDKPR